jgi:FlaA1/EpsC-like NDP-sugar epimerase/lipopolysaccharide/colanic/teichoic acid biosynthesis glycosyltransferase
VFDIVVATVALTLASPLIGLAAIYLKVALRSPAFVHEERARLGDRTFRLFRLRTTGGGHILDVLGLAALPELVNVLRGQMSMVGPRPIAVAEAAWLTPSEVRLLGVRPGLISPAWRAHRRLFVDDAQREGDQTVMAHDRLIELRYLQHRTVITDAWVIARAAFWLVIRLVVTSAVGAWRVLPWIAADSLIAAASFFVAYFLRFLDTPRPYGNVSDGSVARTVALIAVGFALVNLCFRLHRRAWRYAAGVEVLPIAVAALISAAGATTLDLLHPGASVRALPLSVVLVGSAFSAVGFAVFRYRSRIAPAISGLALPAAKPDTQPIRTAVYGAGEVGQLLVRRLRTHIDGRGYKVVGFLDDDPRKRGLTVHGIKVVGGRTVLRAFVARERVEVIVLAMGRTSGNDVRDILALAQGTLAQIKVAYDGVHWMGDRYSAALLRDMRAEDLIGRQATGLDQERRRELVADRNVLVTGACGSIGSELIRQIRGLRPARIVAVDINESGLYDLGVETRALCPDTDLRIVVGDVTNRERMLELVDAERPDVIFHVAAYKHVPLMEMYPREAAWTNVWGTWVMLDAAARSRARHFVLVSTDKAVNPSSMMGATKRMAEILVHRSRDHARNDQSAASPRMTVVRFGNVLGSRGSVIPTFERQIELGGAVTVTHPDMTRYFMHAEEAAALVVEAASLSAADDVFMLDMGDRIRIDELARRMIRLRGLRPNVDVQIEYTGLRPGEKLHEELIYGHEQRVATAHPRVFQITSQEASVFRSGLLRMVQDFAAGRLDRGLFTSELVAIAAQLVDDPQSLAPQPGTVPQALVGRRTAVREATMPGN